MSSGLKVILQQFLDTDRYERLKLFFLTTAFFLVIGAYTLAKELKDSVFMSIVGKSYVPIAKWPVMILLIPAIFVYSKLVDKMRRYYLISFFCVLYGVLGLIFAYFLGSPVMGLENTNSSVYRLFGWGFYLFVEGYSPFVVSVFWAFANSVNSPESAKKSYGIMVAGSKLGGALSAGLAWYWLSAKVNSGLPISDVYNHQILLAIASGLLLLVPFVIFAMMRNVPGRYLHGYEAVYKLEKQKSKEGTAETGVFSGILMFVRYPYVLGIFGMVFFYEVVSTVLSYLRLDVAQSQATSISQVSSVLFEITFKYHAIGVLIALLGTSALLSKLGERVCLVLIPLVSGVLLLYLMVSNTDTVALIHAFVAIKAINYAFSWPVRESLYIPTVKEIKFKSKSWIDAFGSKFAKMIGSSFIIFAEQLGATLFMPVYSFFFAAIIGSWFFTAVLLGRRFDKAIVNNEVIGSDEKAAQA